MIFPFVSFIRVKNWHLSAAWRCRVKDPCLHLTGQSRINWQNDEFWNIGPQWLHSLVQDFTGSVNLFLSSQKHQNVPWTKATDRLNAGVYSRRRAFMSLKSYLEVRSDGSAWQWWDWHPGSPSQVLWCKEPLLDMFFQGWWRWVLHRSTERTWRRPV